MGMFDEIKRLLWVKKAVAESAADKAGEKAKEMGEDLSVKASETWEKTKDIAEDIGEKIVVKAKEAKEAVSDLWDKKDDWTQKTPPADKLTEKPAEETEAFKTGEKLGENAAKTWDKVKEEGKEILDKAVEKSDKVWEKTEQVSEDLWNKAKDAAEKVGKKFDEGVDSMLEKAKALDKKIEEEKDKVDANRDGWADTTVKDKLKEHESTLKGKDDFFERAGRYADGDYSMGKPVVTKKEGEETTEEGMTELPPLPKKDDFADDAIIDDESNEK
jgi:polyhydroxyalkanoate synthesis regulator phasin